MLRRTFIQAACLGVCFTPFKQHDTTIVRSETREFMAIFFLLPMQFLADIETETGCALAGSAFRDTAMISLKKYLDSSSSNSHSKDHSGPVELAAAAVGAYQSMLTEVGNCSLDACPGLGCEFKQHLAELSRELSPTTNCATLESIDKSAREQLRNWGKRTSLHYLQKSDEVKELLLLMAKTAESVGARDQRCASQMNEVTSRLTAIASLDDLTEIRSSIEKSAAELKTSIERMTAEGKAAIDRLGEQVSSYQIKLEAAERIASSDMLTGLRNRSFVERHIERRVAAKQEFCVAIVDIDAFKRVNDEHGHLAGDELLKQFATELTSACRTSDVIGRWGGDEFIIALDCGLPEATAQAERLRKWICGNYDLEFKPGPVRLKVNASIGIAEHLPDETMNDLLARADASMYADKASGKKKSQEITSEPAR